MEWHRRTANLLHRTDVHGHPVTTNYASYLKDYNVLRLRELDYLTSNRYVQDLPMGMAWIHQDRILMVEKQSGIARPHFLLESGSDFRGGSIQAEENYLHLSLWASWMFPYSASGMSWWWVLIDQENFYLHFAAFNRFIEGEDRRGHDWTYKQVPEFLKSSAGHGLGRPGDKPLWGDFKPLPDTVVFAEPDDAAAKHLEVIYLDDDTTAYVWVYDKEAYGIDTSRIIAKRNEGTGIQLLSLLPGRYNVEIWNTLLGEIESTDHITKDDSPLTISLPPFEKDIAIKIKPAPQQEEDEYLDD